MPGDASDPPVPSRRPVRMPSVAGHRQRRVLVLRTESSDRHLAWLARCPDLVVTAVHADSWTSGRLDGHGHPGEAEAPDIVVVAGHIDGTDRLLELAIERRLTVVCDLPPSASAERTAELARKAFDTGAETLVVFPWRMHEALARTRASITDGRLGDLLLVDCAVHLDPIAAPGDAPQMGHRAVEPLTPFAATLHQVDLLRWLSAREWVVSSSWRVECPLPEHPARGKRTPSARSAVGVDLACGDARSRLLTTTAGNGRRRLTTTVMGTRATVFLSIDPDDGNGLWRLTSESQTHDRLLPAVPPNPYLALGASLERAARPSADLDDAAAAHLLVSTAERIAGQQRPIERPRTRPTAIRHDGRQK